MSKRWWVPLAFLAHFLAPLCLLATPHLRRVSRRWKEPSAPSKSSTILPSEPRFYLAAEGQTVASAPESGLLRHRRGCSAALVAPAEMGMILAPGCYRLSRLPLPDRNARFLGVSGAADDGSLSSQSGKGSGFGSCCGRRRKWLQGLFVKGGNVNITLP